MRWIVIVLSTLILQAANIEITSKKFEASQKELLSKFIGDVVVKRAKDRIEADEVEIYFDKRHKPLKIVARGRVRFYIVDVQNKKYKGSAKKIIYFPKKKEYILQGDVNIEQLPQKKRLFAQEIFLDLKESKLVVKGSKNRPVKMIINIEEK